MSVPGLISFQVLFCPVYYMNIWWNVEFMSWPWILFFLLSWEQNTSSTGVQSHVRLLGIWESCGCPAVSSTCYVAFLYFDSFSPSFPFVFNYYLLTPSAWKHSDVVVVSGKVIVSECGFAIASQTGSLLSGNWFICPAGRADPVCSIDWLIGWYAYAQPRFQGQKK